MKPTPREAQVIHAKYEKVVNHLIEEKYAADKIIEGMSEEWYNCIAE